jgi:hypothetical protein
MFFLIKERQKGKIPTVQGKFQWEWGRHKKE